MAGGREVRACVSTCICSYVIYNVYVHESAHVYTVHSVWFNLCTCNCNNVRACVCVLCMWLKHEHVYVTSRCKTSKVEQCRTIALQTPRSSSDDKFIPTKKGPATMNWSKKKQTNCRCIGHFHLATSPSDDSHVYQLAITDPSNPKKTSYLGIYRN